MMQSMPKIRAATYLDNYQKASKSNESVKWTTTTRTFYWLVSWQINEVNKCSKQPIVVEILQ